MQKVMAIPLAQPKARRIHWPSVVCKSSLSKRPKWTFHRTGVFYLTGKINLKCKDYLLYHKSL